VICLAVLCQNLARVAFPLNLTLTNDLTSFPNVTEVRLERCIDRLSRQPLPDKRILLTPRSPVWGSPVPDSFGDCQLHVEFAEPNPPKGEDQDRGNSGVFLQGLYEIQVLDSYQSKTYADGQAGAVYGQFPPLVNASRPPGQWQTYDIVFHGPRFDAAGKLLRPAHITVLHNGVLVQDNVEPTGPTGHHKRPPYTAGPDKLPLSLQDHNHPVRYRNIWLRELN
jgi:hypothetical protein